MKKLLLLLTGGVIASGAFAQQSQRQSLALINSAVAQKAAMAQGEKAILPALGGGNGPAYRGTATPFITEGFGSGTRTSLPTGWTTSGGASGASWHWTNTAATGQFNIGVLNSTTAANGWMIFDSDSLGSITGAPNPMDGYLVSPSYSCTGHATVMLGFQQLFRRFNDSCFVEVSNNNGSTWTTFPVIENNAMAYNTTLANNPTLSRINISSVAANQANVKIRFHYNGKEAGGSFNWLIDDVYLSELDPVDLGISLSTFGGNSPEPTFNDIYVYQNLPLSLVDSLYPLTVMQNYGSTTGTNTVVNAKVFYNGTQVYNQNVTYASIPVNGRDSVVQWPNSPGYKPTAVGSYVGAFSIAPTNDAFAANNLDSNFFNVTDTLYSINGKLGSSAYYLHRPSTSSAGEGSYFMGSRFDIPIGKSDTVSSVSVAFNSQSTPGFVAVGQIYKLNIGGSTWDPVGTTIQKTVGSADISTSAGLVYANFPINNANGVLILDGGIYAAVFTTINAAATSTVLVNTSTPLYNAPGLVGYYGQSSASNNNGALDFASGVSLATGLVSTPYVRIGFGKKIAGAGVNEIPGVDVGKVYPNPAGNSVSVPVSVKQSTEVSITLTNVVGQAMATQNLGNMTANQSKTATFNTAALANGVYFMTVNANGARATSRFVITH